MDDIQKEKQCPRCRRKAVREVERQNTIGGEAALDIWEQCSVCGLGWFSMTEREKALTEQNKKLVDALKLQKEKIDLLYLLMILVLLI